MRKHCAFDKGQAWPAVVACFFLTVALRPEAASADWKARIRRILRLDRSKPAAQPTSVIPQPVRQVVHQVTRSSKSRAKEQRRQARITRLEGRAAALVDYVKTQSRDPSYNYDTWAGKRKLIEARFVWAKALKLHAGQLMAEGRVEEARIVQRAARDYREVTKKLEGRVLEFAVEELDKGSAWATHMAQHYSARMPKDAVEAASNERHAKREDRSSVSRHHRSARLARLAETLGRPVKGFANTRDREERRLRDVLDAPFPTAEAIVKYVKAREAVLAQVTVKDDKGYLQPKQKIRTALERDLRTVESTLRQNPLRGTDPFGLGPKEELGWIALSMGHQIRDLRSAENARANTEASRSWYLDSAKGVLGQVAKGSKGLKNSGDRVALQKDLAAVKGALGAAPAYPKGPAAPAKRKLEALQLSIQRQLIAL